MTQSTFTPESNSGLSPTETQQVLDGLIAGLEDLGDALTILLPLFRSLAYIEYPINSPSLEKVP